MTPTDLLLIGLIVLVLLLVYYFMGRKRTPIEMPQEISVVLSKPPKRPLKIFTGVDTEVKMLSTVEVNMADRMLLMKRLLDSMIAVEKYEAWKAKYR
jgi:hypothetical protein